MRRLASMAFCVAALSIGGQQVMAARQASTPSGLDGTRWSVQVTPDAAAAKQGEKSSKDTLSFKDGKLTSTACGKYGFASSAYNGTQTGAMWSFSTEQVSKKAGKTAWSGEANGEAIRGTMTWMKKDGSTLRYTFTGRKTGKSKAS